jgi:hypothetical protein
MDFTLNIFTKLITSLQKEGFSFQTFNEYLEEPIEKVIVLRHDVDLKPENSLRIAKIENSLGIKGSFYFRVIQKSWNEEIIRQIANLGHEVGYHYETMDTVSRNLKYFSRKDNSTEDLIDAAFEEFCINTRKFREIYPIKTICMHGSPLSKFDNRDIWKKYNYKNLNLTGEPFFDIDFNKVLYLTDTGRRWDGKKVSVRDKVNQTQLQQKYHFKSTISIINNIDNLPDQIMINIHPQRWNNNCFSWIKEFFFQNFKNIIKRIIVK